MTEGTSNIDVDAGFNPLSFFLFFTKPRITIDGDTNVGVWGANSYEVAPGRHNVKVAFKYFAKPNTGENAIDVDVAEGATTRISYRAPMLVTMKGKLEKKA
jgi:hypothetical protein